MDKKLVFAGLLMICLSVFARAVEINGDCSFSEYQCEVGKSTLEVCNDLGRAVNYTVSTEGAKASWLNAVPNQFSLNGGECREITVFMSSECYADPAKYLSDVVVRGDETKNVSCSMNIRQGHIVDFSITPEKQDATQCEQKEYELIFRNLSPILQETEPLRLEVKGLPESWVKLEDLEVFVSKGSGENVKLKVEPPCDAKLGLYAFTVDAISKLNENLKFSDNAEFSLSQGQAIEITSDSTYSTCREENSAIRLKVRNNGKLSDNIKLSLEAPSWVSLDKKSLQLDSGDEVEITLSAAKNSADAKKYAAKIIAESQYNYKTFREIEINLEDCYSASIEKASGESTVCSVDETTYKFNIKNTGKKEISLEVSISGIGAEIDKSRLAIAPGKEAVFNAKLDVSKISGNEETKKFRVKLSSAQESIVKDYEITVQNCKDVFASIADIKLCRGITNESEIRIRNRGTKEQEISLKVAPSWAKAAGIVTVKAGETKNVKLSMEAPLHPADKEVAVEYSYAGETKKVSGKISYQNPETCFGLGLTVKEKNLDASKCVGKTQELNVENKGIIDQKVKLSANVPWIYFDKDEISLAKGGDMNSYFVIVPPVGIDKGMHEITIYAKGQYGTTALENLSLEVFGPEFGKEPIDVNVYDVNVTKLIENLDVDAQIRFSVLNDSNRTIRINSISSPDYNSVFIPERSIVGSNEALDVEGYVDLPESYDKNQVIMRLDVNTDEGTIRKTIRFNLREPIGNEPAEGTAAEPVRLGTGLLTLQNITNAGLIVLIIIIAGLIIYAIVSKPKEEGKEAESGEVKAETAVEAGSTEAAEAVEPKEGKKPKKKARKKK